MIDEAWKLVERRATGEWVNDLARRARHLGLFLIAISQQLSDFAGEYGKALIRNSTMQLFLRQSPEELAYVQDALQLSDQEIRAIARLKTVKRSFSQAYWINGTRGRGTIALRVGPSEYWLATSDPIGDAPLEPKHSKTPPATPGRALETRRRRAGGGRCVTALPAAGLAYRHRSQLLRAALLALLCCSACCWPCSVALDPDRPEQRPGAISPGGLPAGARPFLRIYEDAGRVWPVNPFVLMAIHENETNFSLSTLPGVRSGVNFAGCCAGPMQFSIASPANGGQGGTWAAYRHAHRKSPPAAAGLLSAALRAAAPQRLRLLRRHLRRRHVPARARRRPAARPAHLPGAAVLHRRPARVDPLRPARLRTRPAARTDRRPEPGTTAGRCRSCPACAPGCWRTGSPPPPPGRRRRSRA